MSFLMRSATPGCAGDEVALDLGRAAHHALGPAVEVHLQPRVVLPDVPGAADGEGGVPDGPLDLGHEQLVDRALEPPFGPSSETLFSDYEIDVNTDRM
jgi:hypothetical protein